MNKKSQGLSINVIIIVAIALIVLVVLVAIFTGRLGGFVRGVDAATTCESSCVTLGMTRGAADSHADRTACTAAGESAVALWPVGDPSFRREAASPGSACRGSPATGKGTSTSRRQREDGPRFA